MPVSRAFMSVEAVAPHYTRALPYKTARTGCLICARPRLSVEKQRNPESKIHDADNPTGYIQSLNVFVRYEHDASHNLCNETVSHQCRVWGAEFTGDKIDYGQRDKCQSECVEHLHEWGQVEEKKSFRRNERIGGIYVPSDVKYSGDGNATKNSYQKTRACGSLFERCIKENDQGDEKGDGAEGDER